MTREQEFRKQTEEAKFEAFSVMWEKVNELEKENAELKEKLGDVQMQKAGEKSDLVWKLKTANEQKAEQLTEAKGIINNCVHELQIILLHKIRIEERIASILDKTEQFLKEVSE